MFAEANQEVDTRTMFSIPVQNYTKFEAEIAKLSARSKKAGGWDILPTVIGTRYDDAGRKSYDVYLDAPDVQIEGYRFVATLDHSQETGNIIRMVPNSGVELPSGFRTSAPICQHCNINRIRRDTYVIQNVETGALMQVGSSCLQEMFKTDPRAVAKLAEILGHATERAKRSQDVVEHGTMSLRDDRYIETRDYLENTAAVIRAYGWVSGKVAYEQGRTSTAQIAYANMLANHCDTAQTTLDIPVTDEDVAVVNAALKWARSLRDKPEMNDYENNVSVVSMSPFIEGRSAGIAASIVGVYLRNQKVNQPRAAALELGDMTALIGLFERAGSKLNNPKITIDLPEVGTVVLTVAKATHKVPGSINVKTPGGFDYSDWYGRIHRDGRYDPSRIAPKALETGLKLLAANPAKMASEHGHKTGQCCFCSIPLTDARSVEVGYGKTCAKNFSLPWGKK